MRKLAAALFVLILYFQLSGCWVRISEDDHPEYSHYIGKTVRTTADLFIPENILIYQPGVLSNKESLSENTKYLTVPAGSVLKITGVVSRRLKPGVYHYFECEWKSGGETIVFDFVTSVHVGGKWIDAYYFEFINQNESAD